jgi:hypothetical protein
MFTIVHDRDTMSLSFDGERPAARGEARRHSLMRACICSFTRSRAHFRTHSLTSSRAHFRTHSLTSSRTYFRTDSLTSSRTYYRTCALPSSLTYCLTFVALCAKGSFACGKSRRQQQMRAFVFASYFESAPKCACWRANEYPILQRAEAARRLHRFGPFADNLAKYEPPLPKGASSCTAERFSPPPR